MLNVSHPLLLQLLLAHTDLDQLIQIKNITQHNNYYSL